jgi:hypothetical protein
MNLEIKSLIEDRIARRHGGYAPGEGPDSIDNL